MMHLNISDRKGFTFVELMIVVSIIAILSTIGFISYTSSLGDARDSTRKSDFARVGSALKQYKQQRGYYPIPSPGDNFYVMVATSTGALQGKLNNSVTLSTLETIPLDPDLGIHYSYSISKNRQEYQIAGTLENTNTPIAILTGDYSSVSKALLPTIVLAAESNSSIDTSQTSNENLFVFNNQSHNLVYDFNGSNAPVADGTGISQLLSDAETNGFFWQNSDFRNCDDISDAGKDTGDGTYEVVDISTGILTGTGCTF